LKILDEPLEDDEPFLALDGDRRQPSCAVDEVLEDAIFRHGTCRRYTGAIRASSPTV
jgi:hypothetical protein